jgi:predicted O-linked N-acetylglucosamine transferase (SPINDLY family)
MDPHPGSPTVTFGSCNQHLKISDACLDLWCELLRRLPYANLAVLDVRDQYTSESIVGRFARRGIDARRIALRQRQSLPVYYRAIGDFDIALDAYPHNGATTTFDTLWMGVPLVALRGSRGISRASFSILRSLKMPELIAGSEQEYIEVNVRLAQDAAWRGRLRAALRGRMLASPLMDAERFTRDLEAAYREMWKTWCAASTPHARSGEPQ